MRVTLLVIVLTAFFSSCVVLNPKKHYVKARQKAPYDAIIVPGFPYNELDSTWHDVIKIRLLWSTFLIQNGMTTHVIYSGAAVHSPYVEATYMSLYGKAMGVDEKIMLLDTVANHSSENVFYSFLLARENGLTKIALATDPFQSGMMRPVRRKMKRIFKLRIDQIPIVFDTIRVLDTLSHPSIDVSLAYKENHTNLADKESFFKRLSGTLGMKIDWKKYRKEERKKRKYAN